MQPERQGTIYNSFYYLLHETEKRRLEGYLAKWQSQFGIPAEHDPNCVLHLGDDPYKRPVWSANGSFPSFRRNMNMLFHPFSQTLITPRERLSVLGWPVYEELARTAGLPTAVQLPDMSHAIKFAGNAYHVAVFGTWMITCLACVQLR